MHNLLFFLLQILNITGWQLFFSASAIIISIIMGAWRIDKSRKKDFKDEIDKKADMTLVVSELETRDEKINTIAAKLKGHEKSNDSQFMGIRETLEEIQTQLEYSNKKSDDIMKILINKNNSK